MFPNLRKQLGQQDTMDSVTGDFGDIYQDSFPEDDLLETDPEQVLNDQSSPLELKQQAIQRIKDMYLKPKDEDNE